MEVGGAACPFPVNRQGVMRPTEGELVRGALEEELSFPNSGVGNHLCLPQDLVNEEFTTEVPGSGGNTDSCLARHPFVPTTVTEMQRGRQETPVRL